MKQLLIFLTSLSVFAFLAAEMKWFSLVVAVRLSYLLFSDVSSNSFLLNYAALF